MLSQLCVCCRSLRGLTNALVCSLELGDILRDGYLGGASSILSGAARLDEIVNGADDRVRVLLQGFGADHRSLRGAGGFTYGLAQRLGAHLYHVVRGIHRDVGGSRGLLRAERRRVQRSGLLPRGY